MKIRILIIPIIILTLSAWLSFFSYRFFNSLSQKKELNGIGVSAKELVNLNFYKRNVESLQNEFESISMETFTGRPTSEFISKLPKLAESAGIEKLKIESVESRQENNNEITELTLTAFSAFYKIADFIDLLERSKLPIQIMELTLEDNNGIIKAVIKMKIIKQTMEGAK